MTDNVLTFPGAKEIVNETGNEDNFVDVEKILESLKGIEFDDIIVIGNKLDGEFFMATASGDPAEILWDLERAKQLLMNCSFDD